MFPYPGGKSKICKWINPHFDTTTCTKYVEPFGGAFWNHINGTQIYSNVTYNDLNPHLANVFDCFVNHRSALLIELNKYKSEDRDTFDRIKSILFADPPRCNVQQAAMYLYLHLHAFVGHQINASTRYQHIDTSKWSSRYQALIKKLTSKVNRLNLITNVTNVDAIVCIRNNDSPSTMFYVDPPYFETEHYYTKGDFSQHDGLADMLKKINGKFALSYYDFPHLSTLYPKDRYTWIQKDFLSSMSAGAELAKQQTNVTTKVDTKKHKKTEVLILNYHPNIRVETSLT